MVFVFVSLIFLLFDITVTDLKIDILFDFVGWAFMFFGVNRLSKNHKSLIRLKPATAVMIVLNLAYVVLKLTVFLHHNSLIFISDLIYSALKVLCLSAVLLTIFKQEELVKDRSSLYRAKNIWLLYLSLWAAYMAYAAFIEKHIPKAVGNSITQVLIIATIFIEVLFLIMIYRIKKECLNRDI